MSAPRVPTAETYGAFVVVAELGRHPVRGALLLVRCSCGAELKRHASYLRQAVRRAEQEGRAPPSCRACAYRARKKNPARGERAGPSVCGERENGGTEE
jgi:hypothetical protein